MDYTALLQAISTVGFPIVIVFVLLWYIYQLNIQHKDESAKFTEALNNNTLVLQKLCDTLGIEREG